MTNAQEPRTPTIAAQIEARARELYAKALDDAGGSGSAFIRAGHGNLWADPAIAAIVTALRQAEAYPQHIGDLHLGDRRSDGERLCSHGHPVTQDHPLYWPQQLSQYDDSDPCCLEHAIERYADHSSGYDAAPSADAAMVEELREAQDKRRLALIGRLGTTADLACDTPLPGDLGDVAYDLLREAAAQIASDRLLIQDLASRQPARASDKIGPGHICEHGIRWPRACQPCDDAAWASRQPVGLPK